LLFGQMTLPPDGSEETNPLLSFLHNACLKLLLVSNSSIL
jgi:hypothetical protein